MSKAPHMPLRRLFLLDMRRNTSVSAFVACCSPAIDGPLPAEVFPPHIRGIGNGFLWSLAWVFVFVLWPFPAVGPQQRTGSFATAFLEVPVAVAGMAIGVQRFAPGRAGEEPDNRITP